MVVRRRAVNSGGWLVCLFQRVFNPIGIATAIQHAKHDCLVVDHTVVDGKREPLGQQAMESELNAVNSSEQASESISENRLSK